MAFDYYNSKHDSDMGTEAIEALNSVHAQLAGLYPHAVRAAALADGGHHAAAGYR